MRAALDREGGKQLGVVPGVDLAGRRGVHITIPFAGDGRIGWQACHPHGQPIGPVQWLSPLGVDTWARFIPGIEVGTHYRLWCERPGRARRSIIDPYARAVVGLGPGATVQPLGVVVDTSFLWDDDRRPQIPWHETVIYELHVRGFSRQMPEVPEPLQGTYEGLGSTATCMYLQRLGVTAVELLPVTQMIDEVGLRKRGLTNYWGYNPIACFAPAARYAADPRPGAQVAEFQRMVANLHRAGIEVILDLVFNHTGEADLPVGVGSLGVLVPGVYRDAGETTTGCGNSVDFDHPAAQRWALDCMRYWVEQMHIDGFRIDLATTLGRHRGVFAPDAPLFQCIYQDPVLARVKWIAEPWDLGRNGYQAGNFPPPWREWNDRFRDDVRRYWRGDSGWAGRMATRLAGSSDRFATRGPLASVNYIAAHDGMTLADLGRYHHKHNLDNGEDNRDGPGCDWSRNFGIEGPSDDPQVQQMRRQHARNLLATLLLAQGVPMLQAGDELGRTQRGNNNAYCQDGPLSWLDWKHADRDLLNFVQACISLRKRCQLLRRDRFLTGELSPGVRDVAWYSPIGELLEGDVWHRTDAFAMYLFAGTTSTAPAVVASFFNPTEHPIRFVTPPWSTSFTWHTPLATGELVIAGTDLVLGPCALAVRIGEHP